MLQDDRKIIGWGIGLAGYAQPTLCQHEIRVLDYWQFGRSNVRPHRTCSLPTVDSALTKIRYAQPTTS